MSFNVASNEQAVSFAQDPSREIPTALICKNTLVRTGVTTILSGTNFVVSDASYGAASSQDKTMLCLICDGYEPDELAHTIGELKEQHPSARVVVLADDLESQVLKAALEAGLNGLCSTAMDQRALIKVLELVMLGETYVPTAIALKMLSQPAQSSVPAKLTPAQLTEVSGRKLSPREAEILHQLVEGSPNKVIARHLDVAEATIKVHVKSILRKIGAVNRTQAAIWATTQVSTSADQQM
jgi:two-component system nitrate/nitrite response regulator NarL